MNNQRDGFAVRRRFPGQAAANVVPENDPPGGRAVGPRRARGGIGASQGRDRRSRTETVREMETCGGHADEMHVSKFLGRSGSVVHDEGVDTTAVFPDPRRPRLLHRGITVVRTTESGKRHFRSVSDPNAADASTGNDEPGIDDDRDRKKEHRLRTLTLWTGFRTRKGRVRTARRGEGR